MQRDMTAEAREKLRSLIGCLLAGIAILALLAGGAYWLLFIMFSSGAGGYGAT